MTQTPQLLLRRRETAGKRNARQPLRHVLEADETAYLLDQVGLAPEISAKGRYLRQQTSVLALDSAPQQLKPLSGFASFHRHAEQQLRPREPERHPPGCDGLGVVAKGIRGGTSVRVLSKETEYTVHRVGDHLRVQAPLEAPGSIRTQAEKIRSAV